MFKILTGSINKHANPTDEEIAKIPSFIFCRWLSGNPYAIRAANIFNMYSKIPIVNQYKMVKHSFSEGINYIPYPKKAKIDTTLEIKYLQEHFKLNKQHATEYLELIDKRELKQITDMYKERDLKSK